MFFDRDMFVQIHDPLSYPRNAVQVLATLIYLGLLHLQLVDVLISETIRLYMKTINPHIL